jgi:uncharacterized protein
MNEFGRYSNVVVDYDLAAEMRDGTLLYADAYRPSRGGRFPTLLMRLPYNKTVAQAQHYGHPAWHASQGYLVVIQDTRGRWKSHGDFYPFIHEEEEEGFDSVEWAASLPHSNGRVAMYGLSYPGAVQLQAAVQQPPHLVAICPAMTASQFYDGWTFRGGALSLAFVISWAMELAIDSARRLGDRAAIRQLTRAYEEARSWYDYLPISELPPLVESGMAPYFPDWLSHSSYDEYWQRLSVDLDYSRIAVPALHTGGWYDIFASGTIKNYTSLRSAAGTVAARENQYLLMGPWHHYPALSSLGPVNYGSHSLSKLRALHLAWYRKFLREEPDPELEHRVQIFLVGANRWIRLGEWPSKETITTAFYLRSNGRANSVAGDGRLEVESAESEPPDIFVYDPLEPVPSAGGSSCCNPGITPMGPRSQEAVEVRQDVLIYTSPSLTDSLTIVGPVRVIVWAVSSALDTDFIARLCDVDEAGASINVTAGILRGRFRNSITSPTLLTPGEPVEYMIDLGSTSYVFGRNHRMRLQVTSSSFPEWDRNLNSGGQLGQEGPEAATLATQLVLHTAAHPSRVEFAQLPHGA